MAKGCVYIPKTGKDAGKVFGSKESLAAHMNYTPALTDLMAKFEQSGGKADIDSVTKWLSDNGYLKEGGKKGSTTKPTKSSFKNRVSKIFDPEGAKAAEDIARFHQEAGIEVEVIDDLEAKRLGQERNIEGDLEGLFIADKDSGKIYLNRDALKRVGKTLVYHEGIHPVINIIRNTNPELYKKVLDGIRAEAKRNPAIARAIRQVESVKEYQKRGPQTIEDETIVEVLARIAAGEIDLNKVDKTFKDDLIEFWNKIAKTLRLPTINPNASTQEFRDFAKKLSTALTEGGKLSDVVGAENVKAFAPPVDLSIMDDEAQELIVPGSQITGTPSIGQASIANSRIENFDTKPPKVKGVPMKYPKPRTMEDVLSDSGGAAVFVNSDGTKVGVVTINGKKYTIQGGLDYTFIKKNVNDNVGFAASENQKISTLNSIAKGIAEMRDQKNPQHKGKPVAVFVVSQNGEAMLGEWYAGEYIMEGIDKALSEGTYEGGIDAAREHFSNAIKDVVITTKTEDGKKDSKSRNKLIDMIASDLFDTPKGRMKIADFLSSKEVSFGLRSKINGEILAANPKLSGRGKNQQLKKALADAGHHMEDFWKLFADERFLPAIEKQRLVPEKGKVFANKTFSGFYYNPFVSIEKQIEHTQKGLQHRQFNSKFMSVGNPFLLTQAHDVNKLFPDMGYADNAGYEIYNKANNTDVGKKSSIGDRIKVSEWLNKNGYNKNVISPYSSISLSIYTGYVTEEYKGPGAKIPSSKIKGQASAKIPRTPSDVRQAMEDSGDAVEQAIASGTDPQTAVDDLVGNQDWYNELTPKQKEQFDEILKDEFGVTPKAPAKKPSGIVTSIKNIVDNYYKLKDGDRSARAAINEILDSDPKLKYIYDNISKINKQLQDAGVITDKTDGCP
jgi:hypothetical protein